MRAGATLIAADVRVVGNIQAEGSNDVVVNDGPRSARQDAVGSMSWSSPVRRPAT